MRIAKQTAKKILIILLIVFGGFTLVGGSVFSIAMSVAGWDFSVMNTVDYKRETYKELQEVEEAHAKRYTELYNELCNKTLFKGDSNSKWICMNCGYIHEGSKAPEKCPLCAYPRSYFKPYCEIKDL